MKILFTIGGEDHSVDRDDRLDKILITIAADIQAQRLKEDEAKQKADPSYEIRPVFTAGDYAESLIVPTFDGLLKVEDDRRKAEIGAKYDQVDEKTKIFVTAINKQLVDWAVQGNTASIQKVVDAFGIPIDK